MYLLLKERTSAGYLSICFFTHLKCVSKGMEKRRSPTGLRKREFPASTILENTSPVNCGFPELCFREIVLTGNSLFRGSN